MKNESLLTDRASSFEDRLRLGTALRHKSHLGRLRAATNHLLIVQLVVLPVKHGSMIVNAVVCCFEAGVGSFRKDFHHLLNSFDVIIILVVI